MSDEIKDGFTRLNELTDLIIINTEAGNIDLAVKRLYLLKALIDILETEVAL